MKLGHIVAGIYGLTKSVNSGTNNDPAQRKIVFASCPQWKLKITPKYTYAIVIRIDRPVRDLGIAYLVKQVGTLSNISVIFVYIMSSVCCRCRTLHDYKAYQLTFMSQLESWHRHLKNQFNRRALNHSYKVNGKQLFSIS